MKVVIIGFGWVGQANGIALTRMGHEVSYFDPLEAEFHYLDEYKQEYKGITKINNPLEKDGEDVCYVVCVGDRVSSSGEQDYSSIEKALNSLSEAKGTIVLRSTLLPENLVKLRFDFYVPEFLHEKKAVVECIEPHFFVVGSCAEVKEPEFFSQWEKSAHKTFKGTPEEASYIKYLSNIWNAIRIAFVNEFGDAMRAPASPDDVKIVERVIDFVLGGEPYQRYGMAFDGHCLPKDMRAFIRSSKDKGSDVPLLSGAYQSNDFHIAVQEKYSELPKWYSKWKK